MNSNMPIRTEEVMKTRFRATAQSKNRNFEFDVLEGERLLSACLRNGVPALYGCGTGTCGSCRASVLTGEFDLLWKEAPGTPRVKRQFLLCQATAKSDISFSFLAEARMEGLETPDYIDGKITSCRHLNADTVLVTVTLSRSIAFAAGQFLLMSFDNIAGPRAYTISDSATKSCFELSFIIKLKSPGVFSQSLSQPTVVERPVNLFGPLGKASLNLEIDKDIICIAGSSGLSMALSVLSTALNAGHFRRHKGTLIFAIRSYADVFLAQRIKEIVDQSRGAISATLAVSESAECISRDHGLLLAAGLAHEVLSVTETTKDMTAFIAGPPLMVQSSVRTLLTAKGFAPANIRYDSFT
jgi:toluene monooxygenase electron transfer component